MIVHKTKTCYCLLGAHYRGIRLLLHGILSHRLESRNNDGGYYPIIVLYDLLSHR